MNVGFIGMGNMGQMLVTALARSGVIQPECLYASNRSQEKLKRIATAVPGVRTTTSGELAQQCRVIFLCVKPVETKAVLNEISPYIGPEHLLVTITNTIGLSMLETAVRARIAKMIPSLLHGIDEGVSLLMYGERCTEEDKVLLQHLMAAVSQPYVITESQARVASDLTSCGPAFLSYVFRAMSQAALHYQPDLPPETVNSMIRRTAMATCRLMEESNLTFDDVIARVATPGGITAEGISVLDEHLAGVWEQVVETTLLKEETKKAKVSL